MTKPTLPEVLPRFAAYFAEHPAWGSLHIVLDDCNHEDSSVAFCIEYAQKNGDAVGAELARLLLQMSRTQRGKISRLVEHAAREGKDK